MLHIETPVEQPVGLISLTKRMLLRAAHRGCPFRITCTPVFDDLPANSSPSVLDSRSLLRSRSWHLFPSGHRIRYRRFASWLLGFYTVPKPRRPGCVEVGFWKTGGSASKVPSLVGFLPRGGSMTYLTSTTQVRAARSFLHLSPSRHCGRSCVTSHFSKRDASTLRRFVAAPRKRQRRAYVIEN